MSSFFETSAKVSPRLASMDGLSAYLGMTVEQFGKMFSDLTERGMPQPVLSLGMYDLKAIDLWLDRMSGITNNGRYSFHPPEPHAIDFKADPPKSPTESDDACASYSVAQCMAEYLEWVRAYRKNPETPIARTNITILPAFGHLRVIDLTVKQIRDWHAAIAASPKSVHVGHGKLRQYAGPPTTPEEIRKRRATANHDLGILKAALNKAFREGKVKSDVGWRWATQFQLGEVSKVECLSATQCQKLMFYLPEDFQQLVRGALFSGGRFTELATLTAQDFDPNAGTIYFTPGKTAKSRHVVLTQEGKEFFEKATSALHRTDLIFRRWDGNQWTNRDCIHRLQGACRLAGYKYVTFHTLRHTYATTLVMSGVPLAAVARNLGHSSTKVCQKFYLHLTESYVSEAMRTKAPTLNLTGELDQAVLDAHNRDDKCVSLQSGQQIAKLKVTSWPRKKLLQRAKRIGIAGRHSMHRDVLEQIIMKDIDENWPAYSRGKRFSKAA
jgi:integrase